MVLNIRRISSWAFSLASTSFKTVQRVAWSLCCWFFIIGIAFFIASSSYLWFYSKYVPTALHELPAYFTFRTCESGTGICSFPEANVTFSKDGLTEVLSCGQPYKVILDLVMPESEKNTEAGMFMINIKMYERFGIVVQESARSVMLKYRSHLVTTLMRLLYFFPILTGFKDESQNLEVVLFDEYLEDPYRQALGAVLELRNTRIDFYHAVLKIYAQFSGLSYLLYYWPMLSAVAGVSAVFFSVMCVLVMGRFAYRGRGAQEEEEGAEHDWETASQEETFPLSHNASLARHRAQELLRRERDAQLGQVAVRQQGHSEPDTIEGREYGAGATAMDPADLEGERDEEEEEGDLAAFVEELIGQEDDDLDSRNLRHRRQDLPAQ